MAGFQIVNVLFEAMRLGSAWILYLLIALNVVAVAVCIERWRSYRASAVDIDLLKRQVEEHLSSRNLAALSLLCKATPCVETRVVLTAIECADEPGESVARRIDSLLHTERFVLDRWLPFLGTLGNNAPFIGLLGTVFGIIDAFANLAQDPSGASAKVMAGISEALVATGVGLFVAIPAVVAFNVFQRIVKRRMANAEAMKELLLARASRRLDQAA